MLCEISNDMFLKQMTVILSQYKFISDFRSVIVVKSVFSLEPKGCKIFSIGFLKLLTFNCFMLAQSLKR